MRIEVRWPATGDESRKRELIEDEAARARQLGELGTIVRLWRVPGRWANVGIWQAADATALHDAISSLPLFPWIEVDVEPLARHPSDPEVAPETR